jgi:hypothetical protein
MMNKHVKIIIEVVTEDGKRFRPSDWIERISGNLSTFGNDRRIRSSRYLQPQIFQGQKCLVIDPESREKAWRRLTVLWILPKTINYARAKSTPREVFSAVTYDHFYSSRFAFH